MNATTDEYGELRKGVYYGNWIKGLKDLHTLSRANVTNPVISITIWSSIRSIHPCNIHAQWRSYRTIQIHHQVFPEMIWCIQYLQTECQQRNVVKYSDTMNDYRRNTVSDIHVASSCHIRQNNRLQGTPTRYALDIKIPIISLVAASISHWVIN